MPAITSDNSLYMLAEPFRQAWSEVLSQAFGSACNVSMSSETTSPPSEAEPVSFGITAAGGLAGSATIYLTKSEALALAQKLLSEAQDPAAEFKPSHKQAIEDLARKFVQHASAALAPRFAGVALQLNPSDNPAPQGALILLSADAAGGPLTVRLSLAPEMLASIPAPAAQTAASVPEGPASQSPDNNLDLLLGVDLNLTLRFGQRTLTLREIMELSSGSIIELDRQVQEPADLLLGDRLIAKGEVVIVDGNYGLRITEVSDAQAGIERMHMAAR